MKHLRSAFLVTLSVATVLCTSGCTRAFRNVLGMQAPAGGVPQLETFKPKHAGFQVSMPEPRDEIATDDIMKRKYQYRHESGNYELIFGLAHGSLMTPEQSKAGLDEITASVVKSIDGKVSTTKPIEYYGSSDRATTRIGNEVEGTIGTEQTFRLRTYLIGTTSGKTSYALVVTGKPAFVKSSEADRFISSLNLLD